MIRAGRRQAVHQPGVDRGRRDAGDGDEDQGVDVGDAEPGALEAVEHGASADLLGDADPGVVRLAPGGQRLVLLDRQRQMAAADQDVAMQRLEALEVEVALAPGAAEGGEERLLVVVVRRKRRADGGDPQERSTLSQRARSAIEKPASV